jgi:hypothetical protein
MLSTLLCLLFLVGQLNPAKDTVRLPPGKATILQDYDGKLVELINAPSDVSLPSLRPPVAHWSVDIRNLGPRDVTIRSGTQLSVLLHPNESATIAAKGSSSFVRLR